MGGQRGILGRVGAVLGRFEPTLQILEFFDKIKRERLARRGLSSGKKRRKQEDRHVTESLENSIGVRVGLYGLLALVAGWLVTTSPGGTFEGALLAGWTVTLILLAAAILIFHFNYPTTSSRSSKTFLVIGGLLAELFLIRGVMSFEPSHEMLILPVALIPIFHSVLIGQRIGTFSTIFTSILGALLMEPDRAMQFLALALVTSYTGVLATRRVKKRGRLLRAGFYVGIVSVLLNILFAEIRIEGLWGGPAALQLCLSQLGMTFGMGLLTGMAVSALLPIFEGVFLLTTEISWLEMSDLNHKLLKRMQLEAPGTFHHSLMVAQLAEAAADAVGANSSMCRVCAYFHDVGKLNKPLYFVENQVEGNPHDDLTPTMSALVIVAHVKDGVDMAIKEKLAPEIIDVIQEHHGDSLVYYFYRKAQEQHRKQKGEAEDGQISDEEIMEVDRKNFSYPGPIPQTRESGIISLADAVESASRSIEKPNPTKIRALVDDIVLSRIKDGQLDDCGLTMNDVKIIREVFSKTLRSMLHTRIAYPDEHKKKVKKAAKKEVAKKEAENVVPVEELERQRKAGGAGGQ